MKLKFKIIICLILQFICINLVKAQITYTGSSYSIINNNSDWDAKFLRGTLNMGNPNSWQVFFKTRANYASALYNGKYYVLMSFNRNPDSAAIARLNSVGINLLKFVPSQAYWVEISDLTIIDDVRDIVNTPDFNVLQISLFPESWKLAGDLEIYKTDSDSVNVMHYLNLSIHNGPLLGRIYSELDSLGIDVIDSSNIFNTFTVKTDGLHLASLTNLPYIYFIESLSYQYQSSSSTSYINNFTNSSYFNVGTSGLSGNGVLIDLYEDELTQHIDFRTRNTTFVPSSTINHGTRMAGNIAGAGTLNPGSKGIAFQSNLRTFNTSRIITANFSINTGFNLTNWNTFINGNINTQISSNSFVTITGSNCGMGAPYTISALSNDHASILRPNMLQIFAAGNNNILGTGLGCPVNSYNSIISLFCSSKNNLTVGSVDNNNLVPTYSAYGPVRDGRIKPDLVTLGSPNINTKDIDDYSGGGVGTSEATSIASGCAALIYERYKQIFNVWPKSTLVKGLLMNSTDDIENPGPDYRSGYGSINMYKTIQNLNSTNFIRGTISNGQTLSYTFPTSSSGITSKIMLIWQDLEATAGAAPALVRDLDLLVWNGTTIVGRPSILNPAIPANNAITGADHLNNVEQVTLTNTLSSYTVTVNGFNIPGGATQEFFLLITNDDWGLKLIYPNGDNVLSPGTTETIRWNANSLPAGSTLSLEYSINNGTSWVSIATGLAGTVTQFNWTVPNVVTSQARVRISQTWPFGISDMSDNVFSILGQPQGLGASTYCENSVTLNWTAVPNASSYNIFRLNESTDSWVLLGTSATNSFNTTENTLACYYYTVEAVNAANNAISEKAIAIKLCLTANASIVGSMTLTRSPNGCMLVGTTNIYLTSNMSIPSGSVSKWEISSDNGVSWVPTTLTQTGASQWVIPFLQPFMGGWQYRLTYINYTTCTKIVSLANTLDLDFDFTSLTNVVLDPFGANSYGSSTVTLSQTAGVNFQWQINFFKSTIIQCIFDPITGNWFSCPDYYGWKNIDCSVLKRTVPPALVACSETDEYLPYPSLNIFGNAHFKFTGQNSNTLYHTYLDPWGGPGPWSDDSYVSFQPHLIRCVAFNSSCTRNSDESDIGLRKTGNGRSGIRNGDTSSLEIYPNPVINNVLKFKYNGLDECQIFIYNTEGKEIFKRILTYDFQLDVSDWANGVYFIKFVNENNVQTKRLIIQHD